MVQKIPDPIHGRLLNDVTPTKAGEPFHAVFLAKPCHLALGIAARISLRVEIACLMVSSPLSTWMAWR